MRIDGDPQRGFSIHFPAIESLFALGRGSRFAILLTARIALANTGGFTTQTAEVIKLRSSDTASFHQIDVINDSGVQRKNSFDTDTEAGFAHRDGFTRAAVLSRDYDTFKSLQSFLGLGFLDPDMNADRVARLKLGYVLF
jgi:hypothetical protein